MDNSFDLDRLTGGEKECLRRFLRHQTAKEIALDLGISHHAVEKRLKMARVKLADEPINEDCPRCGRTIPSTT